MDTDIAFTVIQQAIDEFNAGIGRARADLAASEETLASVEYEMEQLRALIAENSLAKTTASSRLPPVPLPSDVEVLGQDVGGVPLRPAVVRAA